LIKSSAEAADREVIRKWCKRRAMSEAHRTTDINFIRMFAAAAKKGKKVKPSNCRASYFASV
jgi:hypothetical protein